MNQRIIQTPVEGIRAWVLNLLDEQPARVSALNRITLHITIGVPTRRCGRVAGTPAGRFIRIGRHEPPQRRRIIPLIRIIIPRRRIPRIRRKLHLILHQRRRIPLLAIRIIFQPTPAGPALPPPSAHWPAAAPPASRPKSARNAPPVNDNVVLHPGRSSSWPRSGNHPNVFDGSVRGNTRLNPKCALQPSHARKPRELHSHITSPSLLERLASSAIALAAILINQAAKGSAAPLEGYEVHKCLNEKRRTSGPNRHSSSEYINCARAESYGAPEDISFARQDRAAR